MPIRAYLFSALLHSVIIAFLLWDWSFTLKSYEKSSVPVIMVDLKKVQIGELTNLPQQVKKQMPQKKQKEVKAEPKKTQKQKTTVKKTAPKPQAKPEPVKPKEQPKPKDAVTAVEPPKKEPKPVKKEVKKEPSKPTPQTPAKSEQQKQKKKSDGLKSLLASVEDIKKNARPSTTIQDTPQTGQEVQDGIDGGTEGSLMQPLTISEKDLIANKLRGCWNVDAGLSGIENMIVEVRAYVNRDGSIRDVKILNMQSDTTFRSVAESARRAIYICEALGEESPFKMLADKRGDNYQGWKEIFVRFNPLDGGVY